MTRRPTLPHGHAAAGIVCAPVRDHNGESGAVPVPYAGRPYPLALRQSSAVREQRTARERHTDRVLAAVIAALLLAIALLAGMALRVPVGADAGVTMGGE